MAFTTANLSLYHSFSKMPAQNSTTLGNAINKSGHTVTASEVWAQDIPYYGKMGSLDDVKSKVQPYARKNDMCYITAGADKGKTFQYDGNGNWTDITATLIDGALIKNANDDVVLLYHKGQTLTNLTADNNANTDSANNAARLWAKRDTEGVTIPNSGTRLIEQFVAPTDKALNGLASVAYAPVIANGSLISGTNYYDYCFSGTILWASERTAATLIDCFEYVGQKVSTVVDTVSAQGTALQNVKDQVDTISDALGLGSEVVGTTLGSRVTANETALKVLLGLAEGDELKATQSIATTAANAVSTSLTGTTDGTIGKAIADAKQETLDAINAIQHFSVVVVPVGQTMENITPVENTIYLVSDSQAADGSYIEYIAFKQGETVVTEKIGSTKLDLSGYTTDAEYDALAGENGRVTVLEGKVTTLTGSGEGSVSKALADAKTYAEGQASAAKSGAETTAANALSAARTEITAEIAAAKEQAIAGSTVTLTSSTTDGTEGITITPNGQAANNFTIGIDQSVIATVATVTAISEIIASNKGELDGKIAGINETIDALTTGDNSVAKQIENAISDATSKTAIIDGDTSTKLVTAAQVATYVASEVGAIDTGVTSISVNGGTAQKGDVSITALTGVAVATHTDISAESISIVEESNEVKLTVRSAGAQVSENKLSYSRHSNYLATADDADVIATFRANEAKTALADTTITGDDLSVTGSGVSVTLGGTVGAPTLTGSVTPATYTSSTKTWENSTYFATASDVATAIADAVGAIEIPDVTWSGASQNVGFSAGSNDSGHYLHLSTAAYTPASETGEIGEWTEANKGYLVTGATVAAAISDVNAKVDALHQTPQFSVVVVAGVTDLTNWKDAVDGGIKKNTIYLVENTEAADGSYIEYIAYENGETVVTERIGTTKTDLSGYAKSVTINGQTKSANTTNAGALNLGTVVTGVYNLLASGTTNDSTQPNESSIYAGIHNGGLHIGIASASDSVMGVSKLYTGEYFNMASLADKSNTAVSLDTVSDMFTAIADYKADKGTFVSSINDKKGDLKILTHNGISNTSQGTAGSAFGQSTGTMLWGTAIVTNSSFDNICVVDSFVGLNDGTHVGYLQIAALPSDAVTVENNFVMNADGKVITTIRPERMVSGFNARPATGLKSFVGDLSNLVNSSWGNTDVDKTFYNSTALETFIGDLSSLTNGFCMFYGCRNLTSFISDLSSLTDGRSMFSWCKLDADSLECIADTINDVRSLSTSTEVTKKIDIYYNCSADEASAAYDVITGKGWSCEMTYYA